MIWDCNKCLLVFDRHYIPSFLLLSNRLLYALSIHPFASPPIFFSYLRCIIFLLLILLIPYLPFPCSLFIHIASAPILHSSFSSYPSTSSSSSSFLFPVLTHFVLPFYHSLFSPSSSIYVQCVLLFRLLSSFTNLLRFLPWVLLPSRTPVNSC